MAITDLVEKLTGGSGIELTVYECASCEATFESAKDLERATCPECLETDVEAVGTAESYS